MQQGNIEAEAKILFDVWQGLTSTKLAGAVHTEQANNLDVQVFAEWKSHSRLFGCLFSHPFANVFGVFGWCELWTLSEREPYVVFWEDPQFFERLTELNVFYCVCAHMYIKYLHLFEYLCWSCWYQKLSKSTTIIPLHFKVFFFGKIAVCLDVQN